MQSEAFEWDDAKAALNWRNHGVSFEAARDVFKDIFAIEWTDDRHGDAEERFVTVGMAEGRASFCRPHAERRTNSHHFGARGDPARTTEIPQ